MPLIIDKVRVWRQNLNEIEQDRLYLGIPLLVSLLIKLILIAVLYNSPINNDGTLYINAARQFAAGNFAEGLALYPMPAYSLLLVLVHTIISDWIFAGFLISVLSIVLVTIPLYYLTKIMFDAKTGFWACLIFAVLPRMNGWSLHLMRDPLFLFFIISCIYFALKSISEKNLFFIGVAFILAWSATLIRIEGVVFIVFYWFYLIYLSLFSKENRSRHFSRAMIWAGIPIGITLLVLLFCGVRSMAFNRFDYVYEKLITLLSGGFLRKSTQIYHFLSEAGTGEPFDGGHYSFASLAKHFMPLIYLLGIVQVFVKVLSPLSLAPLYIGFKDKVKPFDSKHDRRFILLVWFLFTGLGYYFLIDHDLIATRYLIVPAVLLLPWVGFGINKLLEKSKISSHKKMIFFLISIIILVPTIKTFQLTSSRDTTTIRTVNWVKDYCKTNKAKIVFNNHEVFFYIGLKIENDSNLQMHYYRKGKVAKNIELFAEKKNAEIIILKVKTRDIDKVMDFKLYQKIKSFAGNKYTILIYNRTFKE